MKQAAAVALALLAAGCIRSAPPPSQPSARYTLGEPYALGGVWSYPREDFSLDDSGIAAVLPRSGRGRPTANGEIFDPDRLVGAHRTLQLPAIVAVWNLENGREIRIRVNDRGPVQPGRILGLSPRAAQLLDIPPGGAAQIRIRVETAPSQALARALPSPDRPGMALAPVPRAAVETEALAPLPGAREATRIRRAPSGRVAETIADSAPVLPPDPLPESLTQQYSRPGRLLVEAGNFFRRDLAQRQAAQLGGLGARVEPFGNGRQPQFRVRLGPYADLAAADRAVAGVLAAGLPEARLLVE
ncbi:MAG: Endolytic peptidoglycan transglycosylase RlpA [Belnapia sp.]|nr:Endolytic peptidoglycan transglycosylase RlpA [Belnapia sp.]